jgi:hypothetical protein
MTKTGGYPETVKLGPVERWLGGVLAVVLVSALGFLVKRETDDHDSIIVMQGQLALINWKLDQLPAAKLGSLQTDFGVLQAEFHQYVLAHQEH